MAGTRREANSRPDDLGLVCSELEGCLDRSLQTLERQASPRGVPCAAHGAPAPYRPKSTFGTAAASFGASKYGYSWKPKIFPVTLLGNWRRSVLYSWMRSL